MEDGDISDLFDSKCAFEKIILGMTGLYWKEARIEIHFITSISHSDENTNTLVVIYRHYSLYNFSQALFIILLSTAGLKLSSTSYIWMHSKMRLIYSCSSLKPLWYEERPGYFCCFFSICYSSIVAYYMSAVLDAMIFQEAVLSNYIIATKCWVVWESSVTRMMPQNLEHTRCCLRFWLTRWNRHVTVVSRCSPLTSTAVYFKTYQSSF